MNSEELFDGKYKILGVLGKGGMGTVYLAENINLGTLWAIKEISKQSNMTLDLLVEPNILKRLNHPSLPRIFDILEDESNLYVIVDYIEGSSLEKELQRVGRFPEQVVISWAKQICDVLQYLHTRKPNPIIYRDMKPANIILTPEGKIKLIDFGIAREYKGNSDSDTVYIGTRGYAAPEQYGFGQSSIATDIYSLGITLHHLLTGKSPNQPPYEIRPVRYFDQGLSTEIEEIITRCTRLDPEERYPSVQGLLDDINKLGIEKHRPLDQRISFKRLVLAVSGTEFAGELAYIAVRACNLKVAVIELDFFSSNSDIILNIKDNVDGAAEACGCELEQVKAALRNNSLDAYTFERICAAVDGLDNLHVLLARGDGCPETRLTADEVDRLIALTYSAYDITIIILGKQICDAGVQAALRRADYHIVAATGNVDSIREFERTLVYSQQASGIPFEKIRFVAWEYKKGINLPVHMLKKIYHGQAYLGCVSYDPERESTKNSGESFHARDAYKRLLEEYREILAHFCLIPKATLTDRLGRLISGINKKKTKG